MDDKIDALKKSSNQKKDIEDALRELSEAEDSKMLFGDSEQEVIGTGNPIGTVKKNGNTDDMSEMRKIMGLPTDEKKE